MSLVIRLCHPLPFEDVQHSQCVNVRPLLFGSRVLALCPLRFITMPWIGGSPMVCLYYSRTRYGSPLPSLQVGKNRRDFPERGEMDTGIRLRHGLSPREKPRPRSPAIHLEIIRTMPSISSSKLIAVMKDGAHALTSTPELPHRVRTKVSTSCLAKCPRGLSNGYPKLGRLTRRRVYPSSSKRRLREF
jgi:hypothetical protein